MHEVHKKFFDEIKQIRHYLAAGQVSVANSFKDFLLKNLSVLAEIQAAYEKLEKDNAKLETNHFNALNTCKELDSRLKKELQNSSNYIEALKFYADDINYSQLAWLSNIDYDHGKIAKQTLVQANINIEKTFMDKALIGEIKDLAHEIGHYIEKWHNSESELKLHEYLGFTDLEFALFIQEPNSLDSIVDDRRALRKV